MLRIFKILKNTTVEGPGNRYCIWVQGCSRQCNGCYASNTWDFNSGREYEINELFSSISNESRNIEGVTFLGGEPFEQAKELSILASMVKKQLGLSIVTFSGYTYEELKQKDAYYVDELLRYTDILIDGKFDKDKFDLSRPWVGSLNQRYIFLTDRYSEREILKYQNKIELRISQKGKIEINGMGDFKKINNNFYLHLGENTVK